MEKQLIYNSVKCLNCGEILVSHHVHDYKTCSCENETMCDGGGNYGRYGGKDLSLVETNYLYDDAPFEVLREHIFRGSRGKSGKEELKYIKLSEISNEYLEDLIDYIEERQPSNPQLKWYNLENDYRNKNGIKL